MRRLLQAAAMAGLLLGSAVKTQAAIELAPPYNSQYSITDLSSVPGLPPLYGGLVLKAGDPNTLLIGGFANGADGAIYSIGVTRDGTGHINGFSGTATFYASAPYIDGGLAYGPGGVLFYTGWPVNQIGEIKPGSVAPDKVIDMNALGVASSVGSLQFGPGGSFKILSYDAGTFYNSTLSPDGSGTYNILSPTLESTPGRGPEGMIYVPPGSPLFPLSSMLIAEYGTGTVGAYQVDANGNPIVATRQDFITGLTGAEGAFVDPLTGDFLFSTFQGGNLVEEVRGFVPPPPSVPEPSTMVVSAVGLAAILYTSRKSRQQTR
jgi:hypothetical protein